MAEAYACWRLLNNNGYDASWCPGPGRLFPRPCPLVASGRCVLVERADVVVSSLELQRASSRQVVAAVTHLHRDTPVVVQAPQPMLARWAPLFEGNWGPVQTPANKRTLLDSVEAALAKPVGDGHEVVEVPG